MPRALTHRYGDALDVIWTTTAARIGFRIERSDTCFASMDGAGTLIIGTPETLDPDDGLAQMIFHEFCHSLVQGRGALTLRDWGLDNESDQHVAREHATLRVQATLAGEFGLRCFLAPTTDFRAYYDGLPEDPMTGDEAEVLALARAALDRADIDPWSPHLRVALRATHAIGVATLPFAPGGSLWSRIGR